MIVLSPNYIPRNIIAAICLVVSFSHVCALSNLGPIEQLLLSSRLTKIQTAVATKFESKVGPQLLGADTGGTFADSGKDVTIDRKSVV